MQPADSLQDHTAFKLGQHDFQADIEMLAGSALVGTILETVMLATDMRFAAVARVTADRWVACRTVDEISFGLLEGDEIAIDGAGDSATGRIARIYPQIENGRVSADVSVEGLSDAFVAARVLVRLAVGNRTALLVPEEAITTRAGLDFVTVSAPSQGERVVMLGQRHEQDGAVLREVLSGLNAGDTVVLK